jgi:predicted ABC-type transport system involved in lysophospholipase L1 biosynthesis ATPase subunit
MIIAALLLQASTPQVTAESRRLYEPYRQCLFGQSALLAGPEGETSGLDQARTRCLAQNLSAGTNALFAEMRTGASQDEAGERVAALRIAVEQEAVTRARANPNNRPD